MPEYVNIVELNIPNKFGSEKLAMERVAAEARKIGFSENRVEDLKTAVSEACINAIEHGNKMNANMRVGVTLSLGSSKSKLKVDVEDEGPGIKNEINEPSIEKKIEGKEPPRGWGVFLIKKLVDDVKFAPKLNGGNVTSMVIYLNKKPEAHQGPSMESAK